MFADLMVFVEESDGLLSNELNPAKRKFDSERLLVNGFEKTRTELAMDANRRCDNALGSSVIPQLPSCFPAFLIHFQIVPAVAVSSQPGLRGNAVVAILSCSISSL